MDNRYVTFVTPGTFRSAGSTVAVRAPSGAAVGRVDGQVPVRLPRRTSDGARPGDHTPVRVRRTGRPAPSVRHVADAVAPAHGARQVRDVPAADRRHRRHRRFRGRPVAGKFRHYNGTGEGETSVGIVRARQNATGFSKFEKTKKPGDGDGTIVVRKSPNT